MNKSNEPTTKQKELLELIKRNIQENGFPPSIREIAEQLGLSSTATVHTHLQALKKKGLIKVDKGNQRKNRAIELSEETKNSDMIPLVGTVAAGTGVIAEENITDHYKLPTILTGRTDSSDLFMLEVKGESMIDAGIFDGDFVVVKKQNFAQNGDFVVAGIFDEEATIKEFKKEGNEIILIPHNASLKPLRFDSRATSIFGKVISIMRKL